jgi:hypothetical protein
MDITMPAIAAITLADGQSAPVNHAFSPVTTDGAKATWADRSPGAPSGYLVINHEVRQPAQSGAAYRVLAGFNIPVMATVDGVPTVVRNSSASIAFNFSASSTEQERKDMLAFVSNYLTKADVKTSITNIEPFY